MKRCLIVVDMQNDFITGALGFDDASEVIAPIKEKIKDYRAAGQTIIFTQDTHKKDYLKTTEGEHLPVQHCIEGTWGHALYEDIEAMKEEKDPHFKKETFPSLELGNFLADEDYDEIELCGLVSNICVASNAVIVKAAKPRSRIIVDATATKSFDETLHEKSLDVLEAMHIEIKNRR